MNNNSLVPSQTEADTVVKEIIPSDKKTFETDVRSLLKTIQDLLQGDGKDTVGLVSQVTKLETDIHGRDEPHKGLSKWVENLETTVSALPVTASVGDTPASNTIINNLKVKVSLLEKSNELLAGISSRLQSKNKSLQNQLYVQQDRSNFLNLLVGGVHENADLNEKEQFVVFCNDILKLAHISERDVLKAYRKTGSRETEEVVEDENGSRVVLQVFTPGLLQVRVSSEKVREQIMGKARGLGGRRHPVHNHKYFVSPVECEATKAAKSKHKQRVRHMAIANKNKDAKDKDKFYFYGEDFIVNGVLQEDEVSAPSYDEIIQALFSQKADLDALQLHWSDTTIRAEGNEFVAYMAHVHNMQAVKLAYIKVCLSEVQAASIMMAYKCGPSQGSCDDSEYNTGYKLLHLLQSKNINDGAVWLVILLVNTWVLRGFNLSSKAATKVIDVYNCASPEVVDYPGSTPESTPRHSPNVGDGQLQIASRSPRSPHTPRHRNRHKNTQRNHEYMESPSMDGNI